MPNPLTPYFYEPWEEFVLSVILAGKGSKPPADHGAHLRSRIKAFNVPLIIPNLFIEP